MRLDLKPLRKEKKLSQQQVAEALGVSRQHYVGIENNRSESVNKAHLQRLCELFECEVSQLFGSPSQSEETIARLLSQLEQAEAAIAAMREEIVDSKDLI